MNKTAITFILGLSFIIINSCSTSRQTTETNSKWMFSLQGGANMGGITDNTDMTVVSNVKVPPEATVDAFTGATRLGFNAGMHINKTIKRNQIEAGIDYMYNHQTFTYTDAENMYNGVRELKVSQVLFPLTYNFVFLRKQFPHADVQLKAGYMGQLNFISSSETGVLPEYSLNPGSSFMKFGVKYQFK